MFEDVSSASRTLNIVEMLDLRLADLDAWIPRAADDLLTFWDAERHDFIRETVVTNQATKPAVGKTATNRALASLIDLLRYLAEERKSDSPLGTDAIAKVRALLANHLNKLATDPTDIRSSEGGGLNMFKDAHLVLAASATDAWTERVAVGSEAIVLDEDTRAAIRESLGAIVRENLAVLREDNGARVHPSDTIHDFVTFYSIRATDAYLANVGEGDIIWPDDLIQRVERDLVAQIGYHSAGSWSQFDPGELAFQTALLDRLAGSAASHLTSRAIEIIATSQTNDGGWPTSRLISFAGRHLLHVASVEIALALATMLLNQQKRDEATANETILPILDKTFDLIRTTRVRVENGTGAGAVVGWANDRTRWSKLAESWATAIVLDFLIRYRDVVLGCRQWRVLSRYEVRKARPVARRPKAWADLIPLIDRPKQVKPEELNISDPTDDGRVASALVDLFVNPVLSSVAARPKHASLVIPGPPGTRKTSLVHRLAERLGWPLVTLSPPTFLADGLDGFERHAAAVFADLMRLRRAVVFFDECEEFFKKRDDQELSTPLGSRTLGAFITAGMLPRLQALRDGGWVVSILATNVSLDQLDPAVIRPGRFDFQVHMGNPTVRAQLRYLPSKLDKETPAYRAVHEALRNFAATHDKRSEVTWAVLDDIAAKFAGEDPPVTLVLTSLVERIQLQGPPPLPDTRSP